MKWPRGASAIRASTVARRACYRATIIGGYLLGLAVPAPVVAAPVGAPELPEARFCAISSTICLV
jgi:hypothetical protein